MESGKAFRKIGEKINLYFCSWWRWSIKCSDFCLRPPGRGRRGGGGGKEEGGGGGGGGGGELGGRQHFGG